MRFTRIQIRRFGPLARIDSGEESPLPGFVAVLGPNEAGKSAFHQVLGAILYGFHPASGEQNPFSPWSGGDIEIKAEMEVDDGKSIDVQRRLLKTPRGQTVRQGQVEELDNRPLSIVGHIDRRVYSEVYAITLAQLAGLREAAWETVQEQLIVGMGAQDLRSARAVMRSFRDSAKKLWQPTRRGKQRHRELRTELAELGQSRREAELRDGEIRGLDRKLSELRMRLEELGQERASIATRLEVLRELIPLRSRLEKLDELEARVGDRDALADAPRDPVARDGELNDRLQRSEQRIRKLTESQAELRSSAGSLTNSELRVLERASQLRALSSNAPMVHERVGRLTTLESEISSLEAGIQEASLTLLGVWPTGGVDSEIEPKSVDWSAAGRPFRSLEMSALRERVTEAEDGRRRREDLEDRLGDVVGRTPARKPLISPWAAFFVLASVGFFLGSVFLAEPFVSTIGIVLLLLAGATLVRTGSRWLTTRQMRDVGLEEEQGLRKRISEAEDKERHATALARKLLIPLGLQVSHLDAPGGTLVSDISELKNLFHLRHDRLVESGRLSDQEAVLSAEFERLVSDLNLQLSEDRGLALLELGRMLQDVEQRSIRIEEAESEKGRLDAALTGERLEHEELAELRRSFDESVERAGCTPDAAGLEELAERLANLRLLMGLREELEREVGDLDDLRHRIRAAQALGEAWGDDPERLPREQVRLEDIDRKGQELRERIGELQEREKVLMEEDTLDLVDGQILQLRATLREVEWERDRKIVFAELVERAEARFRSEHQPDLLRRAEGHLSAITAGRYERILVGQIGEDQGFFLDASHLPEPTTVASPLSTGIREQVYLALRLAIVEHLDRDDEPLPLLLDEVLVNWDPDRRARVLDLLERLAPFRQIFLFTCHPHIAEEVADRGGKLLSLTPSYAT